MVRVLITWSDGDTAEIDLPQAAIDFYRQQGVIIRIIDQTDVTDRDIILQIDTRRSRIENNFVSLSYMIVKGSNFSDVIVFFCFSQFLIIPSMYVIFMCSHKRHIQDFEQEQTKDQLTFLQEINNGST